MKFYTISIALLLALTGVACQNDAPQQTTPAGETAPTDAASQSPALSTELPSATTSPVGNIQPEVSAPIQPAPATAAQSGGAAAAAGTPNPPHGQPGHQCGIPVGAPLGQTPAATTPVGQGKPSAPVTAPAKTLPQPASTATAPGTNPPHGQPGHQCGIPVGAPLDSKPKQ